MAEWSERGSSAGRSASARSERGHVFADGARPSLDEFQNRGVVAVHVRDEVRLHPGRNHNEGRAEAAFVKAARQIAGLQHGLNAIRRHLREGWHMVVQSPALVEAENEDGVLPRCTLQQRVDDLGGIGGSWLNIYNRVLI